MKSDKPALKRTRSNLFQRFIHGILEKNGLRIRRKRPLAYGKAGYSPPQRVSSDCLEHLGNVMAETP